MYAFPAAGRRVAAAVHQPVQLVEALVELVVAHSAHVEAEHVLELHGRLVLEQRKRELLPLQLLNKDRGRELVQRQVDADLLQAGPHEDSNLLLLWHGRVVRVGQRKAARDAGSTQQ